MSSLGGKNNRDDWRRSLDVPGETSAIPAEEVLEELDSAELGGIPRRRWLQVMGASMALAAVGGCRWKKQEILPFVERPEGYVPGKIQKFASAMPRGDALIGLEVTCVDGRPIKIEGNPRHPGSMGATDVFAQAAILELYDPDRSKNITFQEGKEVREKSWQHFEEACRPLVQRLHETAGRGFRVLAEADSSPTLASLRTRLFQELPQAKWFEYEPLCDDNERAGTILAYGRPLRMHLRLDLAKIIVCIDGDLLADHPAAIRYARDFVVGRQPDSGKMSRTYVIESGMSSMSTMADHRLPLRPSLISGFVAELKQAILAKLSGAGNADTESVSPFMRAVVGDLLAAENRGRSIVYVGASQPPEVHAAVHWINATLGNVGEKGTVAYTQTVDPERPTHVAAMQMLVEEMAKGEVNLLLILGGNPVYNAPADLAFAERLKQVETSIHLSGYCDETSQRCTWHLPRAHFLESWSDGRAYDGTYSVLQPMVEPLRNGRSPIEVLSAFLTAQGDETRPTAKELVGKTFDEQFSGKAGASWRKVVSEGLLPASRWPIENVSAPMEHPLSVKSWDETVGAGRLEVLFRNARSIYDGRFANNGWLQELPDPVTKLTWGNAALVGPATAEKLGIHNGELAVLKLGDRQVRIPIYVLPGQAAGTVEVQLGYGRSAAGKVGGDAPDVEPVGVDLYPLRSTSAMYFAGSATLESTGEPHRLATTQNHYAIDAVGREATVERAAVLIRQATLDYYRKEPNFVEHVVEHPPLKSLWEETEYEGHRWGMAIDLSKCIGCNTCIVACQAENNIPVVGREQVLRGREMHWLRVDRYFRGDMENPEVVYQPLPCQHCELAPCEEVCPVAATMHNREGLNEMVYNRCVGIRYCANNCPYKVRHFNFFNYHKELDQPENEIAKMKYNPQVTIRSRGVMEKCTYCVQRIQAAKIDSKTTGKAIQDKQIQTACQQACPTGAIIFGDLADPKSEAFRLQHLSRAYAILAELNVRPRTVYLAKIRNPHPELQSQDDTHDSPTR